MYIIPNTTVKLFKNCPLDKSYENTIFFQTQAAQTTYFSSLAGYTFSEQTYQRVHSNKIRVAMNAEPLYNCNYLAFQNASFGTKWFYAFVLSVEYINNVTSEITYQIDVLQTWHFDYVLKQCFVEREHTVTDEIGDNLIPENLETGEYVIDHYSEPAVLAPDQFKIALFCTVNRQYEKIGAYWNDYMPSGLCPVYFDNTYPAGINAMITWLNGIPPEMDPNKVVICACLLPSFMTASEYYGAAWSDAPVTNLYRSDGAAVHNKKCLTYPYNFLYVTNYQGKGVPYRYEFFANKTACTFEMLGRTTPDPVIIAVPNGYKMQLPQLSSDNRNYDEMIELSGFPQVPWNVDSFKAWLAQSASSIALNSLAVVAGGLSGNVSVAASGATGLVQNAVSGAIAAIQPPQSRGSSAGSGKFSTGKLTLGFMNKHITPEFLTVIDDYFSMFGYACKQVKIPNRNARPEWTYTKTIGCKIDPAVNTGLPGDDMEIIESLYNAGIRWWNNPAHVGNYTYDNSPSSGGE